MEIANNPLLRNKAYLFAVVIDSTEAFQSKNKERFASKLKIIDPSFNFEHESVNPEVQFTRFASVYIYSSDHFQIPKPKKVSFGTLFRFQIPLAHPRFGFIFNSGLNLVMTVP